MHRALCAATGVVATIGLVFQAYNLTETFGTLPAALRRMSMFFTHWTNTSLAIVMIWSALRPEGMAADRCVHTVVLACITLVGIVFYTLLGGGEQDTRFAAITQFMLHAVTPTLAVLTFFTAQHQKLPWRAILWGLVPPLIYGPTLLIRGLITDEWPYFFLHYPNLGLAAFTEWSLILIAAFLGFTAVFVALERALSR